ncbi:hypothetical protein FIBSPDRAFT_731539 [Athelia psychrophila]|uniref:DUF7907 domain-containing protein n=1 Tax=Athelia psychrophila TaxID=1759441 RepID=A0A166QBI8_9AGAM|nr:hypothetical protein FIBSPDRAFT_731539 [Fibularhizoctonia sp. CBS 109695]
MASETPETQPAAEAEGQRFWLKTAPLPGAPPSQYTGRYLRYHGSGYDTIMVMPDPPKFIRGLPDPGNSRILYTRNDSKDRVWGMVMGTGMKRGGWEIVQLVEKQGDEGFSWKDDGTGQEVLVWEGGTGKEWAGWMVMEWANGHPQLFWVTDKLKVELPVGSERVQIVRQLL